MKKGAFIKFITMLLVVSALLSLTACGEKAEQPAETAAPEETAAADEAAEASVTEEEPAEVSDKAEAENETAPADAAGEAGLPPLPDIDINSWEFAVANSYNSVSEYEPPYGGFEGQGVDERIVGAINDLFSAAREAGFDVYSAVSYRNYEHNLNRYIQKSAELGGPAEAAKVVLGPGVNEHQTGLAFDLTTDSTQSINYGNFHQDDIEETDAYKWMVENCADYGFILRYPEGKEEYYGTPCNNAHFRYVGKEAAKYIMENNLCLEEFIRLYDENAVYVPEPNTEK